MPMNDEVRKAVERLDYTVLPLTEENNLRAWQTIRAELHRLTEIADSVDPMVVRLGEVTEKLEKMRAIVAACATEVGAVVSPTCSEQFLADVPLEVRAVRRNAESKLEAANALLRSCNAACKRIIEQDGGILGGINFNALGASITAHLSEPRT